MFRRTHLSIRTTRTITALAISALAITGTTAIAQADEGTAAPTSQVVSDRGSIHEESARLAAADYRAKAQGKRQVALRLAEEQIVRNSVVDKALAQVGDSYGAGGDGPNVFDCSGLIVYAWRSVGVDLTHYSWAQYKQTQRVSLKDAVPGDLAFYFENGAHHVALYIGDGKVVHASDYGIGVVKGVVKGTPWTNTHFTGMGRVSIK
ncbi:MAG: C40 family peptidase [Actinomycetota bacterium]